MREVARQFNLSFEHPADFIFDLLWDYAPEMRHPVLNSFARETKTDVSALELPGFEAVVLASFVDRSMDWSGKLIQVSQGETDAYLGYVWNTEKFLKARILGDNADFCEAVWKAIWTRLCPVSPKDETKVQVKFWYMGGNGPASRTRELSAPVWSEIEENYGKATREELGRLIATKKDTIPGGGKIVVLHGPPGTGKTTVLRALAQEWKDWCSIDYIVDPERFFGEAAYMTNVLLDSGTDNYPSIYGLDDEEDCQKMKPRPTWRLIIVEDAEEFLKPDAKSVSGQSLSRLLNIGDGLVGQGLNVILLLTTNVKLEEMHEAIKRPGRCLAKIEVPPLKPSEASEWLGEPTEAATLAELYEIKNVDNKQIVSKQTTRRTGQYL